MLTPKYTVTSSPSDNVYSEAQLLVSIFESIAAVTNAEAKEEAGTASLPENERG
jgi:hypothetical protein